MQQNLLRAPEKRSQTFTRLPMMMRMKKGEGEKIFRVFLSLSYSFFSSMRSEKILIKNLSHDFNFFHSFPLFVRSFFLKSIRKKFFNHIYKSAKKKEKFSTFSDGIFLLPYYDEKVFISSNDLIEFFIKRLY